MNAARLLRGKLQSLGVNYVWGLINFTLGVTAGGIFVAAALMPYLVRGG
jgi:hypothetical protein